MTVSAPGYAPLSRPVTVKSGAVLPVEFRLEPLPATLTGAVTNAATGAPVAGATVAAGEWHAQTDADGRYTLGGLPPGAHTLRVSAPGYRDFEAAVSLAPGAILAVDAALTPRPATLLLTAVDATSGGPIAGATLTCGAVAFGAEPPPASNGSAPCLDVALLVPLKRSAEFAAIRKRVADHHHLDAWVEDGLHFFVFQLRPADGAADEGDEAPVAVFAMRPGAAGPISAVVVTPRGDGAEAEIQSLRETEPPYTIPVQ